MEKLDTMKYTTLLPGNELPAKETLRAPHWWLVQRYHKTHANVVATPPRLGIDALLQAEYMGAAEFETGDVPRSWRTLRALCATQQASLGATTWKLGDYSSVWVIAPVELDAYVVQENIFDIAVGNMRLAEQAGMKQWMHPLENPTINSAQVTLAWLLLDRRAPVFWTVDRDLAHAVYQELCRSLGVRGEDLVMFESRKFEHAGHTWSGTVKGIFSDHADLEHPNGQRQRVPYTQIWSN